MENAYFPKLAAVGNDVYVVYSEGREFRTVISRFENGSWKRIFTSDGPGNGKIAVTADDHSFYAAFDEGDKLKAKMITGSSVRDMGTVSGGLTAIAEPGMALYKGKPVLVFRDILGNAKLRVMSYADGSWTLLKEINTNARSFSCCSNERRFYLSATDGSKLEVYKFDGKQWKDIDTLQLVKGSGCSLSMYHGQLIIGRLEDGQKTAKCYVRKNETWSQLGNYITKAAEDSECKFAVVGTAVYGVVNCSNGLGVFFKDSESSESGNTGGSAAATSAPAVTTSSQKNTSAKPKPTKPKPKKTMTYHIIKEAKIQVSWKKSKGRSGYAIYAKRGKKGRYKKVKTVKKQTKATLLLKSGSKYYFKVKPYRMKNKKCRYDKMRKEKGGKPLNIIRVTYSNISGY